MFISFKNIYAYSFDNTIKVYDYALVLTDEQNDKLKTNVVKYIDNYNIDMVLITVKHYNYSNLTDYLEAFYKKNNFGLDNDKSGIIMAIDLKNNNTGIKTFGRATTLYDDIEINDMLTKINQKENSYDKFVSFIKYSNKHIKEDSVLFNGYDILNSINWYFLLIVSSILPTVTVIIVLFKLRKLDANKTNNYSAIECNAVIHKRKEKFITTTTKQIYKNN